MIAIERDKYRAIGTRVVDLGRLDRDLVRLELLVRLLFGPVRKNGPGQGDLYFFRLDPRRHLEDVPDVCLEIVNFNFLAKPSGTEGPLSVMAHAELVELADWVGLEPKFVHFALLVKVVLWGVLVPKPDLLRLALLAVQHYVDRSNVEGRARHVACRCCAYVRARYAHCRGVYGQRDLQLAVALVLCQPSVGLGAVLHPERRHPDGDRVEKPRGVGDDGARAVVPDGDLGQLTHVLSLDLEFVRLSGFPLVFVTLGLLERDAISLATSTVELDKDSSVSARPPDFTRSHRNMVYDASFSKRRGSALPLLHRLLESIGQRPLLLCRGILPHFEQLEIVVLPLRFQHGGQRHCLIQRALLFGPHGIKFLAGLVEFLLQLPHSAFQPGVSLWPGVQFVAQQPDRRRLLRCLLLELAPGALQSLALGVELARHRRLLLVKLTLQRGLRPHEPVDISLGCSSFSGSGLEARHGRRESARLRDGRRFVALQRGDLLLECKVVVTGLDKHVIQRGHFCAGALKLGSDH
mmetsp:Transcript_13400/g.34285  ORF Transcript_13400/g.34285 Transcript_13400/m.34285 type:complete len:521 (-) Transcript_13400:683-2245(-)